MRLLFICLSLLLVAGCSSTNTESTEKGNAVVKEETYTREITAEEQKYIQLILNKDYDTLMKQTENGNSEVQKDYYNIATAFVEQKGLLENYGKSMNIEDDYKFKQAYTKIRYIISSLEEVKYIPEDLKDKVDKLKSWATEKQTSYDQRYTEVVKEEEKYQSELRQKGELQYTELRKEQLQKEADYRTLNPQNVSIGMTQKEVLTEGWGRPQDINKT